MLPYEHYNNLKRTWQLCPHVGPMPVEAILIWLMWARSTTPPPLYKPP